MKPMTCTEVEAQIELFASGECDSPTEAALRRHLAGCIQCSMAESEARQFLGLLDLRLQEPDRMQRLLDRLAASDGIHPLPRFGGEGRGEGASAAGRKFDRAQANRRTTRQRWFALAASVLLPIGLGIWLTPPAEHSSERTNNQPFEVAMLPDRPSRGPEKLVPQPEPFPAIDQASEALLTFHLDTKGASSKAYRSMLVDAAKTKMPMPPEVGLKLTIRNSTNKPMRLLFDDPRTELQLNLTGPGVLRLDAANGIDPLKELHTVDLNPGKELELQIDHLVAGTRPQPVYLFWTEPGDYRLRATLRIPIQSNGETRVRSISGPRIPLRVR